MPITDVKEILMNIPKVMKKTSIFFATFLDGGSKCYTPDHLNWYHSFDVIKDYAEEEGFNINIVDYNHPRGQKMIQFSYT